MENDLDKIIRRKQLLELVGISGATQWRMEKAGQFPARVKIGKGSVGWHLTEVKVWLENRERVQRSYVKRSCGRRASDRIDLMGSTVLVQRDLRLETVSDEPGREQTRRAKRARTAPHKRRSLPSDA